MERIVFKCLYRDHISMKSVLLFVVSVLSVVQSDNFTGLLVVHENMTYYVDSGALIFVPRKKAILEKCIIGAWHTVSPTYKQIIWSGKGRYGLGPPDGSPLLALGRRVKPGSLLTFFETRNLAWTLVEPDDILGGYLVKHGKTTVAGELRAYDGERDNTRFNFKYQPTKRTKLYFIPYPPDSNRQQPVTGPETNDTSGQQLPTSSVSQGLQKNLDIPPGIPATFWDIPPESPDHPSDPQNPYIPPAIPHTPWDSENVYIPHGSQGPQWYGQNSDISPST